MSSRRQLRAQLLANEVLNPWAQFRDDPGRVLANGVLEFSVTIYEDAELTTARATNNYTLDIYGRILGDVHYAGLADIVVKDAAGNTIRTLVDVVATSDGNTTTITIQRESVAAMVTDDALSVGDLVQTAAYYAGNRYGGARYVIAAAGSGSTDNYLYHNLGNGLQAQLLDLEDNRNFLVAGARGDEGTDDTVAMQAVISQGGDVEVAGGFTFVASNLQITRDVRFIGSGAMRQLGGSSGDLFQITDIEVHSVKFRGVELDGNQQNGNGANHTVGWVL